MITADETAKQLGITINNLRQIQFRGNLKWSKRVGRKVYYLASEVEAYAQKRGNQKPNQD